LMYLVLLGLAEVVTVFLSPHVGMVLDLLLLLLLLVHAALVWQRPVHRLLIGLAFVPLIRVVSLSLPLAGIPLVFWYLATSIPLFAAILVTLRLLDIRLVGALPGLRTLPVQLSIGLTGIFIGYIEYRILQPKSLIVGFSWSLFLVAAVILLFSTGYVEELVFRRVMQRTAVERFGPLAGILYVTLFFAILHIGHRSFIDVVFVFAVGLAFGLIVARTGSLLGVTLSHGLTNIVLFLVIPHLISGDISIPLLDPAALGLEVAPAVQTIGIAETATEIPSPPADMVAAAPLATSTGALPPTASPQPAIVVVGRLNARIGPEAENEVIGDRKENKSFLVQLILAEQTKNAAHSTECAAPTFLSEWDRYLLTQYLRDFNHQNKAEAQEQGHNGDVQHSLHGDGPSVCGPRKDFLQNQKHEQSDHGNHDQRGSQSHRCRNNRGNGCRCNSGNHPDWPNSPARCCNTTE
jgi:membrane protease YdiL (CAAX protease family)